MTKLRNRLWLQSSSPQYAATSILLSNYSHSPSLSRTMPAQTTLSKDDKDRVKSSISQSTNKIHFAALGRIYYAHPNPNEWSYAGLQGALAFTFDSSRNALFFRMVDLDGTRGVSWEHECYEGFEYFQDRPYFHSFAGDVSALFYLPSSSDDMNCLVALEMYDWSRVRRRERSKNHVQESEYAAEEGRQL